MNSQRSSPFGRHSVLAGSGSLPDLAANNQIPPTRTQIGAADQVSGPELSPPAERSKAVRDWKLVERFKSGDQSAFDELVRCHKGGIYSMANRLLGNREDAEEITQDTFIRAFRALGHFRGDSAFSTWLYRIATNLACNRYWYWSRRGRNMTISFDAPFDADGRSFSDLIPAEESSPYNALFAEDLVLRIRNGMNLLSNRHREILLLRSVKNASYTDIARILTISVGTVKSRIARAREALRALALVDS